MVGNKYEKLGKMVVRERYQRLVGKQIYLSHTRLDIAFTINVVSQHMHSPKEAHLETVYRILRYLIGSPGRGLFFKINEVRNLEVYTNTDWFGLVNEKRSNVGIGPLLFET